MEQKDTDSKIHVMHVIAGLHHGGAERVIANLCRYMDDSRFRVSVCWRIAIGEIGEALRREGYGVYGVYDIKRYSNQFLRFLSLRLLAKQYRVDILHSHDTGALADAAQASLFTPRLKHIHTFHFGNYPNLSKSGIVIERLFNRFADRLISVGNVQKETIKRTLKIHDSKIETVYNGVESVEQPPSTDLVESIRGNSERVVIGSISTLTQQKGISYLIDVADILKKRGLNCRFLIAGDGPLREELEEKSLRLGLKEEVRFLGWIPNAPDQLIPSLDIFFQPSLWEAMSMVLLEAMASGVPVVTTRVGENPHVVENGVNGYVVEPGNVEEMVQAITTLIRSKEERELFGKAGRERFERHYTVQRMVDRYSTLYSRLMGRN